MSTVGILRSKLTDVFLSHDAYSWFSNHCAESHGSLEVLADLEILACWIIKVAHYHSTGGWMKEHNDEKGMRR